MNYVLSFEKDWYPTRLIIIEEILMSLFLIFLFVLPNSFCKDYLKFDTKIKCQLYQILAPEFRKRKFPEAVFSESKKVSSEFWVLSWGFQIRMYVVNVYQGHFCEIITYTISNVP